MSRDSHRIEEIKNYWDRQAVEHEADLTATNPDPLAKTLELSALRRALDPTLDTLEAGCGNGYNLFELAKTFSGRLVGFDYSPAMVEAADRKLSENEGAAGPTFHTANILDDWSSLGIFPQVFTDRCLINLPSLNLQIAAVENLARAVAPGGKLFLVESTQQGQERLNELRRKVGLDPIPYHWHNLYLDEPEFLQRVPTSLKHVESENFSSLYFVISRVFNAKLTPEGQAPDYLAEINKIACGLPSFGDYGPLKLFTFAKIG